MNINAYLPDELGKRAKEAKVEFSALLRGAVIKELDRLEALAASTDGMVPQEVEATTIDGHNTLLRFTGENLGGYDPETYLTDAGAVILVFEEGWQKFETREEFGEWVNNPHRNMLPASTERELSKTAAYLGLPIVVEL